MVKKRGMRTEKDFLGKVQVPKDAYYGAFTARAEKNFHLIGVHAEKSFIRALGMVKRAAAETNHSLRLLDGKITRVIVKAANEVIGGRFTDQFVIDVFQAGAGTPYNMNCNEVIANRATELLGGKKGEYAVHPNNHVNMSQSSNDVIPTAIRLAVLVDTPRLVEALRHLEQALRNKGRQFRSVVKTGRTHLQDAVPITLGQEFIAYADSFQDTREHLLHARKGLYSVPLGGTAVGTGLNTHPKYRARVVQALRRISKQPLREADNTIEITQNLDAFLSYSHALQRIAVDLVNVCNNLTLLNSGPRTGIGEITLPAVEPGSSIMPGKVNPSILEAATMVSYHVIGNDYAVSEAAMHSVLELNVMTPLVLYKLLDSVHLLTNTLEMIRVKCIIGITADVARAKALLEESATYIAALNPYLGYDVVAYLVKEAVKKNKNIQDVVLAHQLLSKKDLQTLLRFRTLTQPGTINKHIYLNIKNNKQYRELLKKVEK